jgi:hypothetical protein
MPPEMLVSANKELKDAGKPRYTRGIKGILEWR